MTKLKISRAAHFQVAQVVPIKVKSGMEKKIMVFKK